MVEEVKPTKTHDAHENRSFRVPETLTKNGSKPVPLADIPTDAAERNHTGISELDRVLGGGLVPGSLVLVGGDPGIGKSTLLLQALGQISSRDHKALYISGEESPQQVKLRAQRLGISGENINLLAETRADLIAQAVERTPPSVVVVDSIQTVFDPKISSAPGSVSQIREVAARFLRHRCLRMSLRWSNARHLRHRRPNPHQENPRPSTSAHRAANNSPSPRPASTGILR